MPVIQVPFGYTPDGRAADLFILRNANGMQLEFTNLGGIVTRIMTPDRAGAFDNVNLGFPTLLEYFAKNNYYGALVGRYGNRIRNGQFTIDGQDYEVAKNNNGKNHLHGGLVGFHRRLWKASAPDASAARVELTYRSPDGEENYPGNVDVKVVYTLDDDNTWRIDYSATTDAPTPLNLTQHAFFNLNGAKRDVLAHEVKLYCPTYTAFTPEDLMPTGEILPVADTPLDFTTAKAVARDLDATDINGFDNNFVIDRAGRAADELVPCAEVYDPDSGRTMAVATTEPGVQLYTGNSIDPTDVGFDHVKYGKYWGLCLETQHYPDSVHYPQFPDTILRPGQTYRHSTTYRFGTK